MKHVGIIGSGIAGLAAAWLLSKRHRVTLLERNGYFGGHTHTIEVQEDGRSVPVDTGFIVYNEPNYPLLTRLFAHLGVESRDTDMSFAASVRNGSLEYSGTDLNGLFAQRRNLVRPEFLGMLWDILRFNRSCRELLAHDGFGHESLGAFLNRGHYGAPFRDYYLLPMAAAIWSCPTTSMLDFPAATLARFFANHGLLDLHGRPQWKTVVGGSHRYVERILDTLGPQSPVRGTVRSVRRAADTAEVYLDRGEVLRFDEVVLACHADESLALIDDPTPTERRLLSRFSFQKNRAWLHADERLMPRSRRVWSSWNYLARDGADGDAALSVTYWMNRLQGIDSDRDYLVSLNPPRPPRDSCVIAEMTYDHPVFDQAAVDAQSHLSSIQGRDRLWFCGAWTGYGFHEDGLRSAVRVAEGLGVREHPLLDASRPSATRAAPGFVEGPIQAVS